MRWQKLGIVYRPDASTAWARTHAMVPTPLRISDELIRVFITSLNANGVGRPGYVDVDARDPLRVVKVAQHPLLEVGHAGCFDDNGVLVTSVVDLGGDTLFMYYAGFELCKRIRYRIFTGLATSQDGGKTFNRVSEAPVLDRSDGELFFRGGAFVLRDDGRFRLWYVAGRDWTAVNGKQMPVYHVCHQESTDGIKWAPAGTVSIPITEPDEYGFGRPWVVKRAQTDYQMFYSIRRRSVNAYRLGYAESRNGVAWERKDHELGLDVSTGGFDGTAIMYSAVIQAHGETYCFYNGDDFGRNGFAVARLVSNT